MKILIVGGVAGGASAAARLRRLNEDATIIMFEKGDYISFANCGLPYYIGETIKEKGKLTLQTPKSFKARFNVDVRTGSEVIAIHRDRKTVSVRTRDGVYEESYDKLILSPGAEPVVPPIEGSDMAFVLRNIPDTYKIKEYCDSQKPRTAVVVGAGYIGIEMAENLHNLGIDVSIVEMADHAIGPLDPDMAAEVHQHIRSKGVQLHLNTQVTAIRREGESKRVILSDGNEIPADLVIMAVGVRPETSIAEGLERTPRGNIVVNHHMQTSDPDIYAVGDAISVRDFNTGKPAFIPLAGPANKQGRIAADNICGIPTTYKGTQGSAILKCFDMTVACTGMNERQALAEGVDYEKSFTYSASHASYYPNPSYMTIKLLFKKEDGKLLGAQITGYDGVDKRADVLATAIRAGMTVYDLTELELCYAPPYSSAKDPVNMAGYVAENILNKQVSVFHWHDVEKLDLSKVTLLDTRTAIEFANGAIPGAINMPVDNLRSIVHQLDKSKPVYIYCQVGLRGYVTARMLTQMGFEAYNLSGGYRLWNTIFGQPKTNARKEEKIMELTEKGAIDNKEEQVIQVDATGLQCPGPILKVYEAANNAKAGDILEVRATDMAFAGDIGAWCQRTGNQLLDVQQQGGNVTVRIRKGEAPTKNTCPSSTADKKNIVVFSGDLDKAIAAFIIANGAAAMGRKVSIFFTFWGLNILRKDRHVKVRKNLIERMFGMMMPRGSKRLALSKMNMGGLGAKMIRGVMKSKNIDSLEDLIKLAQSNGVQLVACNMSMDVMGIRQEELLDGVTLGGVASMLANAEESDMSMFI